jgi:protein-tyrosine phosphatase
MDAERRSRMVRRSIENEGVALHILFVCTGNVCRSPMAERLAVAYCARLQIPDLTVSSAGTRAVIAHPIHPDAALVLEKLGGDASNFAARQLTSRIASDTDLVLTMTRAHRDAVLELAPRGLRRTFTLSEAARLASECNPRDIADLAALRPQVAAHELPDISDPLGHSKEFFAMVAAQIADLLPPILELCRSD